MNTHPTGTTPQPDEQVPVTFAVTDGPTVTVLARRTEDSQGSQVLLIGTDEVSDILTAWQTANTARRAFSWPSTYRDDDDCMIAFSVFGVDGRERIVMDSWATHDDTEGFAIDRLPELLPETHFTLTIGGES